MKQMMLMMLSSATIAVIGAQPATGTGGIALNTNDPVKQKAHSSREKVFHDAGQSDGTFNVPEWISKEDEWDKRRYKVATRNENGEIVPLSRAEITQNRIANSPYRGDFLVIRGLSTFGQLIKQCDGVFVGAITEVQYPPGENEESIRDGIVPDIALTFRVETNLFGQVKEKLVTIPMRWWEGLEGHAPTNGMRLLVFYARGYTFRTLSFDNSPLGFDWVKPPEVPNVPPHVIMKEGSCVRVLDPLETEKAYIEMLDGYLRLLRWEKRDPDKYYEFLRSLVNSPVWRIRLDAKEDLLWLLGYQCPKQFDLKCILNDPKLDWDLLKDYTRYISIPVRERQ